MFGSISLFPFPIPGSYIEVNINHFNNNINSRLISGLYFRRDSLIMKNSLVSLLWSFSIFLFNRPWLMLKGSPLAFLTPGTLPWPTSWSRSSPACTPHTRIWPSPTACAPTSRGWGRNRSGWRKRPRICSTPLTRWCTRCRISKRTGRLVCRGRDCLEGT